MHELDRTLDWRTRLRDHRLRLGVAQTELARRTGLSLTAVKAYERGVRKPSATALDAILLALGLSPEQANPIRAGAGFAIDFAQLFEQRFVFELETAQAHMDRLPWPAFLTNQASTVVGYNHAFEALLDVDIAHEFPDAADRNMLAYASEPRFARGLENIDELVGLLVGLAKGDPRFAANAEQTTPWSQEAVERFLQKDPAFIRMFLELWEKRPPIPHRTRHMYEVRWRYRGEPPALRFIASLSLADIWNDVWWNEWTPATPADFRRLVEISSGAG